MLIKNLGGFAWEIKIFATNWDFYGKKLMIYVQIFLKSSKIV